jgi:hypothetical protein
MTVLGLEVNVQTTLSRRSALAHPYISLNGSFWFLSAPEPDELRERQELLQARAARLKAQACVLTLTSSFLDRSDASRRVSELLNAWRGCPLFFDVSQNRAPSWIPPELAVEDPFWFSRRPRGRYWKIHGWHTERWVRRYAEKELSMLATKIGRYQPKFVVLGHSQRVQQLGVLKTLCG